MPSIQDTFVSIALGRLQRGVSACCWVIGASLLTQLLIWGAATFLDIRYEFLKESSPSAKIVSGTQAEHAAGPLSALPHARDVTSPQDSARQPVDVNRVLTRKDQIMSKASLIALRAGTIASFMLVPILLLGVLLGVGSATPGVEKTVSSFMWGLVVCMLVLPMGPVFGFPWQEGALCSYDYMTHLVDLEQMESAERWGSFQFYSRFALLPMACIVGIAMVGVRFSTGVFAGMVPGEDHRLDPRLEREASNIKASSLHGGRGGAAFKAMHSALSENKSGVPIAQPMPGESPKRLI